MRVRVARQGLDKTREVEKKKKRKVDLDGAMMVTVVDDDDDVRDKRRRWWPEGPRRLRKSKVQRVRGHKRAWLSARTEYKQRRSGFGDRSVNDRDRREEEELKWTRLKRVQDKQASDRRLGLSLDVGSRSARQSVARMYVV